MTDLRIIKADKKYRKNLLNVYLIFISSIIALCYWGLPVVKEFVLELPVKQKVETLELIGHIVLLLFIPPAIYLIYIGRKIRHSSLLPFPGMKVIRDTRVIQGKKAVFRGNLLMVLGIIMIVTAVLSMTRTHLILVQFKQSPYIKPFFYRSDFKQGEG